IAREYPQDNAANQRMTRFEIQILNARVFQPPLWPSHSPAARAFLNGRRRRPSSHTRCPSLFAPLHFALTETEAGRSCFSLVFALQPRSSSLHLTPSCWILPVFRCLIGCLTVISTARTVPSRAFRVL